MSKEMMMGTLKHNIVALPVILLNMNISLIMSECMKVNLYKKKLTYYVSGVLVAYAGHMRGLDF